MYLEHDAPHCTGVWDRANGGKFWYCDICGAGAHHDQEVALAAIRENLLGITLQELEQDGRRLLGQDGRPWTM